jgi:hypothetical protein
MAEDRARRLIHDQWHQGLPSCWCGSRHSLVEAAELNRGKGHYEVILDQEYIMERDPWHAPIVQAGRQYETDQVHPAQYAPAMPQREEGKLVVVPMSKVQALSRSLDQFVIVGGESFEVVADLRADGKIVISSVQYCVRGSGPGAPAGQRRVVQRFYRRLLPEHS